MNKENWIEKSHDSWSVFKIMGELVEGYEKLSELGPCVSIFGSARTTENDTCLLYTSPSPRDS